MNKKTFFPILISGLTSGLAFAPYYYFFFLFLSFPTFLFFLYNSKSVKEAFNIGWIFGFGYFLSGLHWIAKALSANNSSLQWLVPIAAIIIAAVIAIYIGLLGIILFKLNRKKIPWIYVLQFNAIWTLIEILKSKLFTGFPLLELGYILSPNIYLIQSASIFGIYGLSFLVLCIANIPFLLFLLITSQYYRPTAILAVTFSILTIINYTYGKNRINKAEIFYKPTTIRIIQPSVPQSLLWNRKLRDVHLENIIKLNASKELESGSVIVLPESAIPGYSIEDRDTTNVIKSIIPDRGYIIVGGVKRYKNKVWNSLFVINKDGNILNSYDKFHLVPFGEYLPFRKFFPSIPKLTQGTLDFITGEKNNIFINDTFPIIRPLICYESFFSNEIIAKSKRPELLINITNDAWYGDSAGAYQNADIARMRSVEYGIPMIRAANTGISFTSDGCGRILHSLRLNKPGIIDIKIIFPLAYPTFYSKNQNWIFYILSIFMIFSFFLSELKAFNKTYE